MASLIDPSGRPLKVKDKDTGKTAPPPASGNGALIKDYLAPDLRGRRAGRLHGDARHRRFLGALVRPLQAADPSAREGGDRGQGQGSPRQGEHRREPRDRSAIAHPVDPDRLRLQERPAGGRFHGRDPGKPDQDVHPGPDRGRRRGAGRARGSRYRGRAETRRRGACRARPADGRAYFRRDPAGRAGPSQGGGRSCALLPRKRGCRARQEDAAVWSSPTDSRTRRSARSKPKWRSRSGR